jgi:acyl-CoA thioester hydrolase
MPTFRFYHPIEVRYGDLDPQGHLNNARYLTYMEQARIHYIQHLGLWNGGSFMNLGVILASIHIDFRNPVQFGQAVRVGVRTARLGEKSLETQHLIEDASSRQVLAEATAVLVAYDYQKGESVPVPEAWRRVIVQFENLDEV